MSAELKQLFHSPDELSDAELEVLRVKLQNMRRLPKLGAGFGLAGAACVQGLLLRQKPTILALGAGAALGYAFGGQAAGTVTENVLKRPFDFDILIAQEKRQQSLTMNLAGYGNSHMSGELNNEGLRSLDKPY